MNPARSSSSNMANLPTYPTCDDLSDIKPFAKKKGLYLKPLIKLNVSVQLPKNKKENFSVSNHALMSAVRELAQPDKFSSIKTLKSSIDMVRFEAEVEMPKNIQFIVSRLNGQLIKLNGYSEQGKVRANVARNEFPSRHEWDSFFRDAKQMNELKAGERPDTVHVQDLPVDWFITKSSNGRPSERLVCRIFEQFGAISAVDIPSNDPYRSMMGSHISGLKQSNFSSTNLFETYVQYKDYVSFVCAMDALRGMKLLRKEENQAWTQVIKVDFDRTKHLSETSIRKRKLLREKLMEKERQNEEKCEDVVDNVVLTKKSSDEPGQVEMDKTEAFSSRVEIRRSESPSPSLRKILREEKLLLVAQRKLESIRLLSVLLARIADKKSIGEGACRGKELKPKFLPTSNNPIYPRANSTFIKAEESSNILSSNPHNKQQDSGSYNRGSYRRGRVPWFQNQRGRGRYSRGRGFYKNQGQGRWEKNQNSIDGCSSNFPLSSHSMGGRFSNDVSMRHDGAHPRFNPCNQMYYNNEIQSMYYRYFQGLVQKDSHRSRSRSRSRSRTRYRRRKTRSRSRSRRQSRSRTRTRSESTSRRRQHSSSRSRDSHYRRSCSNSSSKSWSRSSRSRSKSRSKYRSRSRSRSRTRWHKSSSRSKSRTFRKNTKSRSRSRSQRKPKSTSPVMANASDGRDSPK